MQGKSRVKKGPGGGGRECVPGAPRIWGGWDPGSRGLTEKMASELGVVVSLTFKLGGSPREFSQRPDSGEESGCWESETPQPAAVLRPNRTSGPALLVFVHTRTQMQSCPREGLAAASALPGREFAPPNQDSGTQDEGPACGLGPGGALEKRQGCLPHGLPGRGRTQLSLLSTALHCAWRPGWGLALSCTSCSPLVLVTGAGAS